MTPRATSSSLNARPTKRSSRTILVGPWGLRVGCAPALEAKPWRDVTSRSDQRPFEASRRRAVSGRSSRGAWYGVSRSRRRAKKTSTSRMSSREASSSDHVGNVRSLTYSPPSYTARLTSASGE